MIWNKEKRINNFSYGLRNNLFDGLRDVFINRVYEVLVITNEIAKQCFEEAVYEMSFNVFKEIFDMCNEIGYKEAAPTIKRHINVMMSTENPSYPGEYEIDEEKLANINVCKLKED